MKSDEGFSDMSDKSILIDCLNENVILILIVTEFETPEKFNFSGVFFYSAVAIKVSV